MAKENVFEYAGDSMNDLRRRVEETTGIAPVTATDFERLSEAVRERTGSLLSPTTLKRIWGYLNENTVPRHTTLDVLARCCGWHDYADFTGGNIPEIESGPVGTDSLRADKDVRRGERVRLMWAPARVCVIEYLGDSRWRVVESEGTRLKTGDTFRCQLIVSGEPLYLDDLVQGDRPPAVYVCGRRSGVGFERM